MCKYNFETLSPQDFEILTRDLLQKELDITLESFKSGKDNGIDLRYSENLDNDIIVQCKHYQGSTFKDLIKTMKEEVKKIEKLSPKRYILVTSLPLSPANKNKIIEICSPYITKNSDIYSQSDLNNLLERFPEIEKNHFKLWMTSTNILEQIFNADIYNKTTFKLEQIKDKIQIFVPNPSVDKANKILEENNFVVISGAPGVGKTTLGDMLILQYISDGYEFINITENIDEACKLYKRDDNKKQIFYYDDFLGETNLTKNEDSNLIMFIRQISKVKNKKLILATREYILQQTKLSSEKIENFEFKKCIIDLEEYSSLIKAQILYNHLYFSELPYEYINALLADDNYNAIINHKNYNPRIIEHMTKANIHKTTDAENYFSEFMNNLDNPEKIWNHAFENHLNKMSRSILFALATYKNTFFFSNNKDKIKEESIKVCSTLYSETMTDLDFKNGLKVLDGDFINISDSQYISFSNPSVRDFLENYIYQNDLLDKFIDMANSLEQYEWINRTYFNNKKCSQANIRKLFDKLKVLNNDKFNMKYFDLMFEMILSSGNRSMISEVKNELDFTIKYYNSFIELKSLLETITDPLFLENKIIENFLKKLIESILNNTDSILQNLDDYLVLGDFIKNFEDLWEDNDIYYIYEHVNYQYDDLVDAIIEIYDDYRDDLYFEIDKFQELIDKFGLPQTTRRLKDKVEEWEEDNEDNSSKENSLNTIDTSSILKDMKDENTEIKNLFDSLNKF